MAADINRINFLAKKEKSEGLTDDEKREQVELRKEYIAGFRKNFASQLDNIVIQYPDGRKVKPEKKH